MVKHTETIPRQHPANYLSVFDHFVGLALKKLKSFRFVILLHSLRDLLTPKKVSIYVLILAKANRRFLLNKSIIVKCQNLTFISVLWNRCTEKLRKIHSETPAMMAFNFSNAERVGLSLFFRTDF